nr:MAG TPA: hypothetical protein [Caudoviricetes sp.]
MGTVLEDTKKALGIVPGYEAFDDQILMHINTCRMELNQLGAKCEDPIEKTTGWEAFFGIDDMATIKSYIAMKVRLIFDPPSNSFVVTSYQKLIEEAAWRLIYQTENDR